MNDNKALQIDAGSATILGSISANAQGISPTVSNTNSPVRYVTIDSLPGALQSGGFIDLYSDGTHWFVSGHLSYDSTISITFGDDPLAISSIGCADGTAEVSWSDDVVGCGGPTMSWETYRDSASTYCATGWEMAGASIVNEHLTTSPYTDTSTYYAFDGEGCDGNDAFGTTWQSYSQSRPGCGWTTTHHMYISLSTDVRGIVCERS